MKLWAGRFQKETDAIVNDFNSSIRFDQRMYREDIQGSLAHSKMLGDTGVISQSDAAAISQGLRDLLAEIEAGSVSFSVDSEDIHMNLEQLLTQRIGDAGKRLHTARSRNDQVAVDLRLYLRTQIDQIHAMILDLIQVLLDKASLHQRTVMPGYTHLQRAQPITFAHHLLAYGSMLRRDAERLTDCRKRLNWCPLGSGALAGTTYPIDRFETAQLLGFDGPMSNSLDGVSDRDYVIELLSALSMLMMHLSRFAEEVIAWCSWEFKFVELDDAYSTGSSIMPQKKNPDVAELVRGKTGRVYGSLISLLTTMKSLPLAYNKDMQEDKEPVFDAVDTVKQCLPVFSSMIATMEVCPENMLAAAKRGFINATDAADYLTKKGVPFRDAYKATGQLVYRCSSQGKTLEDLSVEEFQAVHPAFDEGIYAAIDLNTCVAQRLSYGGPSVPETTRQIKELQAFIRSHQA